LEFLSTRAELDDLTKATSHVDEARRIVLRQKGRIIRLRSAGVDTLDAETALRLLESNLQTFDEHRRALKSEQQELHSENRVRGWPTPRPRLIAAE
jgi:hypothetical protein